MARVLVIDADAGLRARLSVALTEAGHDVEVAAGARAGAAMVRASAPDVVVLEPCLPDGDGETICGTVKTGRSARSAVLVLSADADEETRVRAFEQGADDFVAKPFSERELLLRIRALLRRRGSAPPPELLVIGPVTIDRAARRVTVDGERVELTRRELDLLLLLCDRGGRVQSREVLVADLWGSELAPDGEGGRVVDSTVKRLRRKLGRAADLVTTVRGAGYRLAPPGLAGRRLP